LTAHPVFATSGEVNVDRGMAWSGTLGGTGVLRTALVATSLFVVGSLQTLAQDIAAGEKDFLVCRACHQIGPNARNAVGPVLNGVVGRPAGTFPDYAYSQANKESGLTWTPEELDRYLTSPQTIVPHTKMIFPGLKDEQKRRDVIAFLDQFALDGQKKQ
jgi:cytochrome c